MTNEPPAPSATLARRPVFLAAIGDVNNIDTWSGIPFHFLAAARPAGLIDQGLPLEVTGWPWRARRIVWNALRVVLRDRPGGFQYSVEFLERLWRPFVPRLTGGAVINCFPLFPPSVVDNPRVEKWFFLDQTLRQAFDHYGAESIIGARIAKEALAREQEGYRSAAGIIVHSAWAAESVRRDCGIASDKIHVVLPGANLDPVVYSRWQATHRPERLDGGGLKLVFVGKDWRRKGLDRLLRGLRVARSSSSQATLRVIGCARESLPADLASVDGVEWFGFVDKRSQPGRFLDAVAACDVGCLLSRAEAGGIAIREYHALGLAVMGTAAGGSPEHTVPGASVLVPLDAGDNEIAALLISLERDREALARMRRTAWEKRFSVTWDATVQNILAFWPKAGG